VPSPSKISKSGRVRLQFSHIDYETCSLLIQPPVSLSPRSQPPSSSLRAPPFRVSLRRRHRLRRPRRLRSASGVVASSVVDPVASVLRRPRRFQVLTCTGFVPYCGLVPHLRGCEGTREKSPSEGWSAIAPLLRLLCVASRRTSIGSRGSAKPCP